MKSKLKYEKQRKEWGRNSQQHRDRAGSHALSLCDHVCCRRGKRWTQQLGRCGCPCPCASCRLQCRCLFLCACPCSCPSLCRPSSLCRLSSEAGPVVSVKTREVYLVRDESGETHRKGNEDHADIHNVGSDPHLPRIAHKIWLGGQIARTWYCLKNEFKTFVSTK
jgi:hypothetical protein